VKAPARLAVALVVGALAVGPFAFGQEKEERKKKPVPHLEDVVSRATHKARHSDEGLEFERLTVIPQDKMTSLLVAVEYKTGELGLFSGSIEPSEDQYVILDRNNVALVREALNRLQK
jgi:glucose dehydrogenase